MRKSGITYNVYTNHRNLPAQIRETDGIKMTVKTACAHRICP